MDSVRNDLIRILNQAARAGEPIEFAQNATLKEIALVAQLINNGYLQGDYATDGDDRPCQAVVTGISLSGRNYVQELEKEHFKRTPIGKTWKGLKYVAVYLGGILSAVLVQWLIKYFHLD
jgi:hypothetical protein